MVLERTAKVEEAVVTLECNMEENEFELDKVKEAAEQTRLELE